ncbi:metal ABC transporter permease [Desulfurivibrio dismutans]|uniref:metal ABC transporter permease n=1 Tax=Desulfurivibrio dismutans TaxID=1398908 RepID=UPI0023D9B2E5|nr:metal ABC transporter permease [Desulfurivibrio alkaliphilus]MDF1614943.1 metal ABC transporter permease [Desulfurivibrio alkaliphilus]
MIITAPAEVAALGRIAVLEFFEALRNPDIPFFRYAFVVGLLASVSFGIVGTYVVAKRISYLAGAIAHCVLGGVGAGLYLQHQMGISWFDPLYGALIAALLAALIIGLVSLHAKQREDTVIGALWATGMAVGLLFIAKTPGYVEPMSYLFGNILLLTQTDIWLVLALDLVVVTVSAVFYHKLLAVCFDEEFSRLRGLNSDLYHLLLLCLTALTVVLLVRVVGIIMVIALLTLPAAVAGTFARTLGQMMLGAIGCCMLFVSLGLGISFLHDLPSGPTIILVAAGAFMVSLALKRQ